MPYVTRTLQLLGLPAPWTLAMPAPRVVGHYGRNADAVAVETAGHRVERLGPDPVVGAPRESIMALLERAAKLHGTVAPYTLVYPETSKP